MTLELQPTRGVVKNYGARITNHDVGGRNMQDLIKTAHWVVRWDEIQVAPTASNIEQVIPANSSIMSVRLRVIEPVASTSGTTDLTMGLREKDGTLIATTGLILGSEATNIQLAIAGNIIDGVGGSLIGTGIGAADGELVFSASVSDLTAGVVEVIVEYMTPITVTG